MLKVASFTYLFVSLVACSCSMVEYYVRSGIKIFRFVVDLFVFLVMFNNLEDVFLVKFMYIVPSHHTS